MTNNPCPTVVHDAYETRAAAEAVVRSKAAHARQLLRPIQCTTCGWWRVVQVTS